MSIQELFAIDFYSKATGDPNNTATWGTNTDGTGATPADFTSNAQVFNLRNGNPGTLTANWTVSGTGSKVVVGDGTNAQTLSTGAFTIAATVDVANNGTFNVASNSTSLTIGTCASGSTVSYNGNLDQSVRAGTYHHLILTNAASARNKTASGDITVNGDFTVNTNNTLIMGINLLSGLSGGIAGNGTITTTNTSAAPIPAGKTWSQNITYSSTSSQNVVKGIYTLALNVAGAVGSRIFPNGGDTIEVRGAFTANAASVTYTTTGTRFLFSGAAQTLTFVASSSFNFGYVSFTVASANTKTIAGAGFTVDTLNVGSLSTLAMSTFQLGGTLNSIGGNGIVTTANTGATPIPSGKVWTQTINYNGAAQTIVAGTYASLTYAAGGTKTAAGNLVVNTLLTSTGTLELGTFTLSGTFTNSGTGTINTQNTTATPIPVGKTWTQTVLYNATTAQTVVKGIYGGLNVTGTGSSASRTFPSGGDTIEVRGAFTAANTSGATYTTTGTRFLFNTVVVTLTFNAGSTFNMGLASFSSGVTHLLAGHNLRADTIVIASGTTLNLATFLLAGSLNSITGTGTIRTQNTTATPLPAGRTWTTNITYDASGTQTIVKGTYTLALSVNGGNRTFPTGGDTVEVRGAFTASSSSVTYTTTGTRFLFTTTAQALNFGTSAFNFGYVSFTVPSALSKTIGGAGFSADTLDIGLNCTVAMQTNQLTGTLNSITGNGTITTAHTATSLPYPAGKTWSQNITFSSTSSQTVPKGVYTAALNVSGAAGARVFPSGRDTIEVRGNFTASSNVTYTTTGTRFIFSGANQTLTFNATSIFNFGYVSFTGTAASIKTIATSGFNADTINVADAITLNMVTFVIGGNINVTSGSGTIQTQALTSAVPSGKTWLPLVNYNSTGVNQNVIGGTYTKLTIFLSGNSARTKIVTGNLTVNDTMLVTATGNSSGDLLIDMQTNRLIAGSGFVLSNGGVSANKDFNTQSTDASPLPSGIIWPVLGIVNYNGSGNQTVVTGTYSSLTFTGTGNRTLASGDIDIVGTLTASAGPTIVGGTSNVRLTGAAQTIALGASGSFNNFRAIGTGSKTVTASTGTLTVDGELEVISGFSLVMNNNQLAGNITSTAGAGTITTTSTATFPIAAGKTWLPNITYSATTSQNVVKGIYTSALNVAGGVGSRVFPTSRDTVEVRGNFTANAASVTYTTTGTRFIFSGGTQSLTFVATSLFNFGYVSFAGTTGTTKTIVTAGFNADTINVAADITLNMGTLVMGGNVNLTTGTGTITTQATTGIPANKTWSQTVSYNAAAVQNIAGGTYNKLVLAITTAAITKTATGNITVNDTMTMLSTSSGGVLTLAMSTFQLVNGGAFYLYNVGTALKPVTTSYTNADTSFKALPSGQTWPGLVTFGSTSIQTVPVGIYTAGITSSAAGSRTFSAMGTIEVQGAFTVSGTSVTYTNNGTNFLFSGGTYTLTFSTTSPFTFNNVSFTGTNVTKTVATAGFSVNGNLNIDTTVTLNMATFAMGGNPTLITGAGILLTSATVATPLPTGETWTQTVNYKAGNQNVVGGRYANIAMETTSTTSVTKTALNDVTVDGRLTYTTTGTGTVTIAMGLFRLIDGGNFSINNNGTSARPLTTSYTNADTSFKPFPSNQTWLGLVTFGSTSMQTVPAGIYTLGITSSAAGSRTFSGMGTIEVRGPFSASGASITYTNNGSSFLFSGAAQTLTFSTTSLFTFNNVSFTGSGTKTIATAGFNVNGNLTIVDGITLNMVTFAMGGNPNVISGTGTITTQNTGTALPAGEIWTQTVRYNSTSAQNISGGVYPDLFIGITTTARTKTATGGDITVNDTLTLSSTTAILTLAMGNFSLIAGSPSFVLFNDGTPRKDVTTNATSALPLPNDIVWPGNVTYGAAVDSQVVARGEYRNLTLSGAARKIASGNVLVRGTLTLTTTNPSVFKGAFDMGSHTLTFVDTALFTSGLNDISGIVRRTGPFVVGTAYSFGNFHTKVTFEKSGGLPSEMSIRTVLGDSVAWKPNGIKRQFEIIQTGGTNDSVKIQLKYLTAELNGNIETRLVHWEDSIGGPVEKGRSFINTTNKFVELSNINITNYPSSFGSSYTTLAGTGQPQIIWVGVTSTDWGTTTNWNTNIVPDSTDDVIIPDSASTPFSPTLSATSRVKTISIEEGGVLTSPSGGLLSVYGGSSSGLSSWDCAGTFNPSTGTVTFLGGDATYVGITNFNNVTIDASAILTNRESSVMRIGNTITNNGIWRVAALTESTIEYNRNGSQTVINPNGITTSGYYNLIISGTGTKTLPADFNMKGDFINNGTISTGARISFNGSADQRIGGSSSSTFTKLILNNSKSLLLESSITVTDSVALTSGSLDLNGQSLTLAGTLSGAGTLTGNVSSNLTINGTGDFGTITFTEDRDTLNNVVVNRASGGSVSLANNLRVAGDLTITSGRLMVGANTLTLEGDFSGSSSGTIAGDGVSSKINIEGSGTIGSLFFDQTTTGVTNRFQEFYYNRPSQTITLGNTLQISETVIPDSGTLASAGNLVLISNASNTARIADGGCTTCNYISGNVVVERNILAWARRWRFLGSPVQLTTLADWQNEVFITGPGSGNTIGTVNSNGFDATGSNAAGVFWYDETPISGDINTGWTPPSKITDTLLVGRGYRVFIRGDRSDLARLTGVNATQNEVTVNLTGTPNQGDINMPVSCTFSGVGNTFVQGNDGWNLLSNPYASPYDWDAHYSDGNFQTNIDPTIWILDATTGGYVSYSASAHDGDLDNGIIPSGASFWVKANDLNPTLTFKEQFKTASVPKPVFYTNPGESFSIKMILDSITSDKVLVKYIQDVSENYDKHDILKLPGTITISAYASDSIQLALSARPATYDPDTIKLRISAPAGTYKLQFANSNKLPLTDNILLFDNYTATVTDLKVTNFYPFNIVSGVPASQGFGRFYIVIGNSNALPVHLLQFTAHKHDTKKVKISWTTAQEVNSSVFEVERSKDGQNFEMISQVKANGNTNRVINYSILDNDPLRINYYRLKQVDYDGTVHYSSIVKVIMDELSVQSGLKLYPVPATEYITIENVESMSEITVFDVNGREVLSQRESGISPMIDIRGLSKGMYIVKVKNKNGEEISDKFTKE